MKTYAYIGLVLALLAFTKWYSDRQFDFGVAITEVKYEKLLKTSDKEADDARTESANAITAITSLWLSNEAEKKTTYEKIYEDLNKRADDNSSCNYSVSSVELFNQSSDGIRLQESVDTSELDDRPTTVTKTKLLLAAAKRGEYYTTLERKYRTLRDSVNKLDCVTHQKLK